MKMPMMIVGTPLRMSSAKRMNDDTCGRANSLV